MMRFRTFLLISLVIVFFACLPLIIFEVIGEGETVIALAWIGFFITLPIGAVVLGVFWICSVFPLKH
jgi:hypothetical protein